MDDLRFDQLTRSLATSRRRLLRDLAGVVGAGILTAVGFGETAAQTCRAAGRTCREDANCCAPATCRSSGTGRRVCACPSGTVLCHGTCVDPTTAYSSDTNNCGGCDQHCPRLPNGVVICQNGRCAISCSDGFIPCRGACIPACTAADACHDAGVCDTRTGQCTNPPKPNGIACTDGNACTQTDTCQDGVCTSGTAVTCAASDQCHDVGTCDPATGICANPLKANGAVCDAGNPCTSGDGCQGGVCTPGRAKDCTAQDDQCNTGVCNQTNGQCVKQPKAVGTSCDADHDLCTIGDACDAGGNCLPGAAVVCTALGQCHLAGTCDPTTGACSNPTKPNGTGCTLASGGNGHCCGGICQACCASTDCDSGQACVSGQCVCDATTCPNGCCNGTQCIPKGSNDTCGTGGGVCRDCTASDLICGCVDAWCVTPDTCCQANVGPGASCSATAPCCRGSSCEAGTCCAQNGSECSTDAANGCCFGRCVPYEPLTCGLSCPGICG